MAPLQRITAGSEIRLLLRLSVAPLSGLLPGSESGAWLRRYKGLLPLSGKVGRVKVGPHFHLPGITAFVGESGAWLSPIKDYCRVGESGAPHFHKGLLRVGESGAWLRRYKGLLPGR